MINKPLKRQICSGMRLAMIITLLIALTVLLLDLMSPLCDCIQLLVFTPGKMWTKARWSSELRMKKFVEYAVRHKNVDIDDMEFYNTRYDLYPFGRTRFAISSMVTTNSQGRLDRTEHLRKCEDGKGEMIVLSEKVKSDGDGVFCDPTVGFGFESGRCMRVSNETWRRLLWDVELRLRYSRRYRCWESE